MAHYLDALFNPSSVAVVGVSTNRDRPANKVIRGLVDGGYQGRVYAVGSGTGHPDIPISYPTLNDLPEAPDVVFGAVNAVRIPELMTTAARLGVKFGIVFTAGFAEMNSSGALIESSLVRSCRELGMRIVGPNCMGVFNSAIQANVSEVEWFPPGHVGFATQSGNIALSMFNDAPGAGLGFSTFVSFGNQADIPVGDYVEYMGQDPNTHAVLLYVESLPDGHGPAFIEACRRVSLRKPVVVLKGGRTDSGRRAAESHTARLSSAGDVFSAAFRQGGVVEVGRLDQVIPSLQTIMRCPPLLTSQIAVVGSGGGHSTVATDALEERGLHVPEFGGPTQSAIGELLPDWAPKRNPIDMTGVFVDNLNLFSELMEIVVGDDATSGILAYGLYGGTWNEGLVDPSGETYMSAVTQFARFQHKSQRPVVFFSPFADSDNPVFVKMRKSGVPCFNSIEMAASALASLRRRHQLQPRTDAAAGAAVPAPAVARGSTGDTISLSEFESLRVAVAAGIDVVEQRESGPLADGVVDAAASIGFPVVLKAKLDNVSHKSDLGAVEIGLRSPDELRAARERIYRSVAAAAPSTEISGFTVSRQVAARRELMFGARRDPTFGPVVVVGLGGVTVELAQRTLILIPPVNADAVRLASDDAGLHDLFAPWRGEPGVPFESIADTANRLFDLMSADRGIESIDLNPMLMEAGRLVAVDAAVHRWATPATAWPAAADARTSYDPTVARTEGEDRVH